MRIIEILDQLLIGTQPGDAYAGIGSRETPDHILELMMAAGYYLSERGLILRSGGADGADRAFEMSTPGDKREIYLPWRGFNNNWSPIYDIPKLAFDLAKKYHPMGGRLHGPVLKLMARNSQQVLGMHLDHPVKFVLCWTKDGADGVKRWTGPKTGGTGQAIRIAAANGIPVVNLATLL